MKLIWWGSSFDRTTPLVLRNAAYQTRLLQPEFSGRAFDKSAHFCPRPRREHERLYGTARQPRTLAFWCAEAVAPRRCRPAGARDFRFWVLQRYHAYGIPEISEESYAPERRRRVIFVVTCSQNTSSSVQERDRGFLESSHQHGPASVSVDRLTEADSTPEAVR